MDTNEEKDNPISILVDIASQFREASDAMIEIAEDEQDLDIPDVFNTAASLITTITSAKAGKNPNNEALQQLTVFEDSIHTKEKELLARIEKAMNKLTFQVDELQENVTSREFLLEKEIDDLPRVVKSTLDVLEHNYKLRLEKTEAEWQSERESLIAKEEKIRASFDGDLKQKEEELRDMWAKRISDLDIEISQLQSKLQQLNSQKRMTSAEYANELVQIEKRHQREEFEYKRRLDEELVKKREELEQTKQKMKESFDKMKESEEHLKSVQKELEESLKREQKKIENENALIMKKLSSDLESYQKELAIKQHQTAVLRADSQLETQEVIKRGDEKIREEQKKTDELIAEKLAEIDGKYGSSLKDLDEKLQQAEKKRVQSLELLRSVLSNPTQNNDSVEALLHKRHLEAVSVMKEQLKLEKIKLQEVLAQRSADIDEQKRILEEQLMQKNQEYTMEEERHKNELQSIQDQWDKEVYESEEAAASSINEAKAYRDQEIEKLKRQHQKNVDEINLGNEQKIKQEMEKAYKQGLQESAVQTKAEISSTLVRIQSLKREINEVNNRISKAEGEYEKKLAEYETELKKEYEVKKVQATEKDRKTAAALIKKQRDIESEIQTIQEETKKIQEENSLLELQASTEETVEQPDFTLDSASRKVRSEHIRLISQEIDLQKDLKTLEKENEDLTMIVQAKEQEIEEYRSNWENRLQSLLDETQRQFDSMYEDEKRSLKQTEEKIEQEREKLMQAFEDAKQSYKTMQSEIRDAESRAAVEAEALFESFIEQQKTLHMEKADKAKLDQLKRVQAAEMNIETEKAEHILRMNDIARRNARMLEEANERYNQSVERLDKEQFQLHNKIIELKSMLEAKPRNKCIHCDEKKRELERLIEKEAAFLKKKENMSRETSMSELRASAQFQTRGSSVSRASLTSPRPSTSLSGRASTQSKRPQITTPRRM